MKNSTQELISRVKKIEIRTKRVVDGLLGGAYISVFRGRGIEFSEVREYTMGDDVRAIDWNVTARMDHPYVKEFIEERNLRVYLVLDISGSSDFGGQKSKKETAIDLCASIAFAALRNNDCVGLCLFSDKVEKFISPRRGKSHILRIVRDMIAYEAEQKGTNINSTLAFLNKVVKKRSIIFLVSDFFGLHDFGTSLRTLGRNHDVIVVNMHDRAELSIPSVGYVELEDQETGEQILLNTSDVAFQKQYAALLLEKDRSLRSITQKGRVDLISLHNHEDFSLALRKFFRIRKHRMFR